MVKFRRFATRIWEGEYVNRLVGFAVVGIGLVATLDGCGTTPSTPVARRTDAASCAIAGSFPICDADIRKRFAEISPTDKILDTDFDDSVEPVTLTVTYTPEVAGPNLVKTKVVVCVEYDEAQSFGCQFTRSTGYYDTDPVLYILAENNVDPGVAKKVVHLWMEDKLTANEPAWLAPLDKQHARNFILEYGLHGVYMLEMFSSGCNGPVYFKIEGEGDAQLLHLFRPPEAMCV